MARLLVTGGCGFIGSHLCEALLAQGHAVRVLDDLSTGSQANLAPGATLMIGNVEHPEDVRRAMEGIEGCFHLAAIASVQRCTEAWLASHHANLSGTIAVLEGARVASRARGRPVPVVYASSAAIYGASSSGALEESVTPSPLSAYGADKLGCELHARVAGLVYGVPTLGLRFFNVFGPRQDPRSPYSGVISIFCERLSRGEPITIYGDGGQTRDFVFVEDVVGALIAGIGVASPVGTVLNVCTGRATSVLKLAQLIASACGTRAVMTYQPARAGDIRQSVGSARNMRKALASPTPMALEAGIARVLEWSRAGSHPLAPLAVSPLSMPAWRGFVQNA
ncbi:NAD-dependent epimerase/dehydratase family protein [Roseococcus sp.]|uniref:NAD-dependent epimerase/dehydratase family protein n=1 Tax=Roseococcus sp. TaxID=2109646 RepID=UPI003BAD8AEB